MITVEKMNIAQENRQHVEENRGVEGDGEKVTETNKEDVIVSRKSVTGEEPGKPKPKAKVLMKRDTNKQLHEDEARNLKLFREKILEAGKGYTCK